jgi:hypothetical protein
MQRRRVIAGAGHLLLEADERDPECSLLCLDIVKIAHHGTHQFFQAVKTLDNVINGVPRLFR